MMKEKKDKNEQIKKALKLLKQARQLLSINKASALPIGQILYELQKDNFYRCLTEEKNFAYFMEEQELDVRQPMICFLTKIYETYILKLGYKFGDLVKQNGMPMGVQRLYKVSFAIDEKNKDDWFSRLQTLKEKDLLRVLKYGSVDAMTCKHSKITTLPEKYLCDTCGETFNEKPNVGKN